MQMYHCRYLACTSKRVRDILLEVTASLWGLQGMLALSVVVRMRLLDLSDSSCSWMRIFCQKSVHPCGDCGEDVRWLSGSWEKEELSSLLSVMELIQETQVSLLSSIPICKWGSGMQQPQLNSVHIHHWGGWEEPSQFLPPSFYCSIQGSLQQS